MARIKMQDADKAALFSFASTHTTTQAAEKELRARGWSDADAQKHVHAAIVAGAYLVVTTTRAEAANAVNGETTDASI